MEAKYNGLFVSNHFNFNNNRNNKKGDVVKTQMKAVWAILIMTTIWLTMNSSKINTYANEQKQIDDAVNRMISNIQEKEMAAKSEPAYEPTQRTFKETFAEAREEYGAGDVFVWKGNIYTTDYKETNTYEQPKSELILSDGTWVRNSDDNDDYCTTNDRDECGVCGGEGQSIWYADRDGDGLGDANTTMKACEQPLWTSK